MIIVNYNVKIENEKFGKLVDENFVDPTQYKLFLKMIHGCLELKNDLTFFNGVDFLIHIPYNQLSQSIILSKLIFEDSYDLTSHMKSKIESLVTK